MTSRQRVIAAINHEHPDKVPVDLGSTGQTGISASVLYKLREALRLPRKPIEINEILQMLGTVDDDVRQALGVDTVGLYNPSSLFGIPNGAQKPFIMQDGTPVTISEGHEYDIMPDGSVLMYPMGDRKANPSGLMPAGGYFFDGIDRAPGFDEDNLTPIEDFRNAFGLLDEKTALYLEKEAMRLYSETDYGIIGNLGGGGLGDAALLPGLHEPDPKGIRKFEDWMMAHLLYPDYIKAVFTLQTEIMQENLEIYRQAVGDKIQVIWISGTDFGTQKCELYSPEIFRELYKPFYKRINGWVHEHTAWKTFYHCCGSVVNLLDDFVDMGVDILNPVQLSANGMDASMLKQKYGEQLVFWGGGIDTQKVLPFGSPEDVRTQVRERLKILSAGGGYVFNTIHNIVGRTPVENIISLFEAVKEFNAEM